MFKQPFAMPKPSLSPNDTQVLDIDVGETIRAMDQQYGTQFEIWIRSESNIDCVIFYLRKFVIEFELINSSAITRAIKWMVQEWSVQKSAELLIKLFYHWGIGHPKFISLVSELSHDWRMPLVVDLVAALVVGESSYNAASFIQLFTHTWEPFMVIQLCRNIATRLRWNDRYCLQFLLRYAVLTYREGPTQRVVLNQIRQQFETRSSIIRYYHRISKMSPGAVALSSVDFTMTILQVIVRDLKMYRDSHPKYTILTLHKMYAQNEQMSNDKSMNTLLYDNNIAKSRFEESPQGLTNQPTPRSTTLVEKLTNPSPSNPNNGIILGLPIVDE